VRLRECVDFTRERAGYTLSGVHVMRPRIGLVPFEAASQQKSRLRYI
jgi:hypothetical protein